MSWNSSLITEKINRISSTPWNRGRFQAELEWKLQTSCGTFWPSCERSLENIIFSACFQQNKPVISMWKILGQIFLTSITKAACLVIIRGGVGGRGSCVLVLLEGEVIAVPWKSAHRCTWKGYIVDGRVFKVGMIQIARTMHGNDPHDS